MQYDQTKHSLIHSAITADHLAQLVFLGELTAQGLEIGDQAAAGVEQGFLGGTVAVGLDAEFEGCKEGVRNCGV